MSGPELAIDRIPRPWWTKFGLNSSSNGFFHIDSPPFPVFVGSPPWICKANSNRHSFFRNFFFFPFSLERATDHKVADRSVKFRPVVITILTVFHKVFARFRHNVAVKFEIEGAKISQESYVAWRHNFEWKNCQLQEKSKLAHLSFWLFRSVQCPPRRPRLRVSLLAALPSMWNLRQPHRWNSAPESLKYLWENEKNNNYSYSITALNLSAFSSGVASLDIRGL